jgi:hypothetical protein
VEAQEGEIKIEMEKEEREK